MYFTSTLERSMVIVMSNDTDTTLVDIMYVCMHALLYARKSIVCNPYIFNFIGNGNNGMCMCRSCISS